MHKHYKDGTLHIKNSTTWQNDKFKNIFLTFITDMIYDIWTKFLRVSKLIKTLNTAYCEKFFVLKYIITSKCTGN